MAFPVFDELIASRFAPLAGLHVSGTVPLKDELANELLASLVQSWSSPQTEAKSNPQVAQILSLVRKLQVRTVEGVIHVDFEIGV